METSSPLKEPLTPNKSAANKRGGAGSRACWIATLACRCALGVVFIYAGVVKAKNPAIFADDIRGFRILSEVMIVPLSFYAPFLEILVGAGLALRIFYSGALLLSGGMLAIFIASLGSALWRGLNISCGCFGHSSGDSSVKVAIARDVFLLVAWLILLRSSYINSNLSARKEP